MTEGFRKILIRGVNWIGDAVLTTPAIKAVRKAFPDAHISLLVKPLVADIFKGNPDINEIILYENRFSGIAGKLKLSRMLRARGFNTAILLQNAFDAALITWLAGIPERIGYRRDWRGLLLTKAIPVTKDVLKTHQVHYYLNLLKESLNITPEEAEPYIYLDPAEISEARTILYPTTASDSSQPLIGINPGATYGSAKRWVNRRFAELINKTINELNARVVLFGSESELDIMREITSRSSFPSSRFLNMTGKTGLRQLAALISECDVVISNDSGPMHMAAAMFVPTIAIFGSTESTATGPLGEGHKIISKDIACSPCLKRECPEGHIKCMTEISTEDVFNVLRKMLVKEKAVFLDRDGTLNEDVGYLNSFSNLRIFRDAIESLERLKRARFKLVGITNQSGIARGFIGEEFVEACNAYIQKTLGIDDFYYCPHHPDDNCQCRKPRPLLLRKASLKHGINLKASYVIGDKTIDMLLAKEVGAKGVLVLTGHEKGSEHADFIARDLSEAVDWILKNSDQ
jgi:heptosyltransferase-2